MATTKEEEVERDAKGKMEASDAGGGKDADALLKEFMLDVSDARRTAECERILGCFKINPYEILALWKQDEATASETRKQFRQRSLFVHPDKCKHPQAKEAFELVTKAYKDLCDEETKKEADATIRHAREELRRERRKLVKNDNAYLAAAALKTSQLQASALAGEKGAKSSEGTKENGDHHSGDPASSEADVGDQGASHKAIAPGVAQLEADYEASEGFQQQLRKKAQDLMTQLEWRRRQLGKRIKGEKQRVEEQEEKHKTEMKKKVDQKKTWEKGREKRVSNWRDFMQKKKKKRKT